ncbi:MAG: hypothetical protein CSA35_03040 [Dethiosulfovibrio peptidovorans]|nr:MAG: hypothetical protein CSA35_03040 [Dethiosulfovibrio peptidovorans]
MSGKASWRATIGLARRAGLLVIGQDRVLSVTKKGKKRYVIVLSSDHSDALRRSLGVQKGCQHRVVRLGRVDRRELGSIIGLSRCQVVALPEGEGLTGLVIDQLVEGGEAVE